MGNLHVHCAPYITQASAAQATYRDGMVIVTIQVCWGIVKDEALGRSYFIRKRSN